MVQDSGTGGCADGEAEGARRGSDGAVRPVVPFEDQLIVRCSRCRKFATHAGGCGIMEGGAYVCEYCV